MPGPRTAPAPTEPGTVTAGGDSSDHGGQPRPATVAASRRATAAAERAELLGRRLAAALRGNRTELLSAAVLALAILGALTSWGALDIASAAAEPAPIILGPGSD